MALTQASRVRRWSGVMGKAEAGFHIERSQFQESLQSPGLTEEELPDPISQSIEPEVWNPEEPFRGFKGMTSQNPKLHPESQVNGGEVGRGHRQDHQGLKTVIDQATDILEAHMPDLASRISERVIPGHFLELGGTGQLAARALQGRPRGPDPQADSPRVTPVSQILNKLAQSRLKEKHFLFSRHVEFPLLALNSPSRH